MWDGTTKKIEDIVEGDIILGYDETTQRNISDTVVSLVKSSRGDIITYTLEDGTTIEATPDHPIYVSDKGWSSANPEYTKMAYEMDVKKIEVGDRLLHNTGTTIQVTKITQRDTEPTSVYTFGTETVHNYYANGFLSHNMPKGFCNPVIPPPVVPPD